MSVLAPKSQKENVTGLVIALVLFVTVLILAGKTPSTNLNLAFRVFLALFAALIAVYIPGSLGADLPGGIKAGGAIVIFLVVFLFNPGEKLRAALNPPQPQSSRSIRTSSLLAVLLSLVIVLATGGTATSKAAAETSSPDWVVAFNFVKVDGNQAVSQVFSMDAHHDPGKSIAQNKSFDPSELINNEEAQRSRWIGHRGQVVRVVVRRLPSQQCDVAFEELPRETQFAGDLGKLIRALSPVAARAQASPEFDTKDYVLTRTRATLKITVTPKTRSTDENVDTIRASKQTPTAAQAEMVLASEIAEAAEPLRAEVITGPREHLYLSTGVPFHSIDEFKLDDSGEVVPKDVPKKFLIGVNWQVGDLLTSDHKNGFDGFSLGFQLQADSKPLTHAVLDVGYRLPESIYPGTGLQFLTPFFGVQRSEQDRDNASGEVEQHTVWQGVWGLSLNLDKALGWLKPE